MNNIESKEVSIYATHKQTKNQKLFVEMKSNAYKCTLIASVWEFERENGKRIEVT